MRALLTFGLLSLSACSALPSAEDNGNGAKTPDAAQKNETSNAPDPNAGKDPAVAGKPAGYAYVDASADALRAEGLSEALVAKVRDTGYKAIDDAGLQLALTAVVPGAAVRVAAAAMLNDLSASAKEAGDVTLVGRAAAVLLGIAADLTDAAGKLDTAAGILALAQAPVAVVARAAAAVIPKLSGSDDNARAVQLLQVLTAKAPTPQALSGVIGGAFALAVSQTDPAAALKGLETALTANLTLVTYLKDQANVQSTVEGALTGYVTRDAKSGAAALSPAAVASSVAAIYGAVSTGDPALAAKLFGEIRVHVGAAAIGNNITGDELSRVSAVINLAVPAGVAVLPLVRGGPNTTARSAHRRWSAARPARRRCQRRRRPAPR